MMVMLILRTGAARTRKQMTNAVEAAEGDSFPDVNSFTPRVAKANGITGKLDMVVVHNNYDTSHAKATSANFQRLSS